MSSHEFVNIRNGLSEASRRLQARFTTESFEDQQQAGFLIFVV
jgi:hypothetical protein